MVSDFNTIENQLFVSNAFSDYTGIALSGLQTDRFDIITKKSMEEIMPILKSMDINLYARYIICLIRHKVYYANVKKGFSEINRLIELFINECSYNRFIIDIIDEYYYTIESALLRHIVYLNVQKKIFEYSKKLFHSYKIVDLIDNRNIDESINFNENIEEYMKTDPVAVSRYLSNNYISKEHRHEYLKCALEFIDGNLGSVEYRFHFAVAIISLIEDNILDEIEPQIIEKISDFISNLSVYNINLSNTLTQNEYSNLNWFKNRYKLKLAAKFS
ncbi:MAG: hypothetical protein LBM93_11925, partial [Oscillospiraceae bacterium]|jgi:hypothetical protein|nr:hypothetical protein [Oscillospiraceae bacterium]